MSKTIAPRLADGSRRENIGHGLPAPVRAWGRLQAERRGESFSWYLEQLILADFERRHMPRRYRPAYLQPKRNGRGKRD